MVDDSARRADRLRAIQIINRADSDLVAMGIVVWRIRPADGVRTAVSYEDRTGHGLPGSLLTALADFPEGTVELRRVAGPTQEDAVVPPGLH